MNFCNSYNCYEPGISYLMVALSGNIRPWSWLFPIQKVAQNICSTISVLSGKRDISSGTDCIHPQPSYIIVFCNYFELFNGLLVTTTNNFFFICFIYCEQSISSLLLNQFTVTRLLICKNVVSLLPYLSWKLSGNFPLSFLIAIHVYAFCSCKP